MILSLGIDIVEVDRIRASIERLGRRFVERVFTPSEIDYCEPKGAKFVHFAGRFAAKEAAMKALGTGWGQGVGWHDVEVLPTKAGPPHLVFHAQAQKRFEDLGASRVLVSISHTNALAIAQVIIE